MKKGRNESLNTRYAECVECAVTRAAWNEYLSGLGVGGKEAPVDVAPVAEIGVLALLGRQLERVLLCVCTTRARSFIISDNARHARDGDRARHGSHVLCYLDDVLSGLGLLEEQLDAGGEQLELHGRVLVLEVLEEGLQQVVRVLDTLCNVTPDG